MASSSPGKVSWIAFLLQYPDCTHILGDVKINGKTTITNLGNLSNIDSISGSLNIADNDQLDRLFGLHNLTYVGDFLAIFNNDELTNVDDFDNLKTIVGPLRFRDNRRLQHIRGLAALRSVSGVSFFNNRALESTAGLEGITAMGGLIIDVNHYALASLEGFKNVKTIDNLLRIDDCPALTSLRGFENLERVGQLIISDNNALERLNELQQLIAAPRGIEIANNKKLTSLRGLENVALPTNGIITIRGCKNLRDCAISSFCEALRASQFKGFIFNNGPGCKGIADIKEACTQQE
jgi:hypothetical protein